MGERGKKINLWITPYSDCELPPVALPRTSVTPSIQDRCCSIVRILLGVCVLSQSWCAFSFAAWCCQDTKSSREKKEGPFRSLTRPMSLVVRAAITSNVTAASGNKVVKWLRWLAAACVRCWQQKLLKRLFTQPDFLQNLREEALKILPLALSCPNKTFLCCSPTTIWKS